MSVRRSVDSVEFARLTQDDIALLPLEDRLPEDRFREDVDDAHLKAATASSESPFTTNQTPSSLQGAILIW